MPDKLSCILVCKHWYEVIRNSCLYCDLEFYDNVGNIHAAIEFFKEEDCFGKHVILSQYFPHLSDLIVGYQEGSYMVLVTALQVLPHLESFSLYVSHFVDTGMNIELENITFGQIKMLDIAFAYSDHSLFLIQANGVIKFALRSCPLLKVFSLESDCNYDSAGTLNFCFSNHDHIGSISVYIRESRYFTFSLTEGKRETRWLDEKDPVTEDGSMGEDGVLHMVITYRGENVILDLETAPVAD